MRTRVLVVAQQTALCAAVAHVFTPKKYRVEVASSEKRARQLIDRESFDAAVVAPASLAGGEVAFLREVQDAVGRLVLLADDASASERFAAQFPDALVSPARAPELDKIVTFLGSLALGSPTPAKATIEDQANPPELLHFADCTLDVPGRIFVDAKRQEVALTRREFALLFTFARNPGRVLSRAQLRDAIDGGSTDAYDRSIDMLVTRLRRKIEPDAAKPRFIVTVPGTGYKFVPRVQTAEPAPAPPAAPTTKDGATRDAQHAERRQLTVLSCQTLGFAALAAKSDPEDLDQAIRGVYAVCGEVIARFGGTMVRGIGDNVLAYFGHPQAHENDAENAVRAALELLRAVGKIEAAPIGRFRARIGVATGLMLVGDLRSGEAKEPVAVGEALNLALHMQTAAPADGVVIGLRTRDLVGRLFDCRELAPIVLEEGADPTPVWRVLDEVAGMPRFDALHRVAMLKMVGREAEIERLLQLGSSARRGNGRVVLVTGEAGIGKSRLIIELEDRLRSEPHATIRYSGLPHQAQAPMSVLLDELQGAAGFARNDTAPQKVEKLRRAFAALDAAATEATALISGLLGLPCEPSPEISQLSPQKRKERTFAALLARIESMASRQPLLAVLEDVHWVDPTSLEFLALLIEHAGTLQLLLVIAGRPEFVPQWPDHSYVTTLTLSRLGPSDSATLIHDVAGDRRVPAPIEAQILARADGVPLFVEELTKSVLEHGANGGGLGPLRVTETDAARSIPTTLQGLLLARFDRLDRAKEIAPAAAVIGREFSFELLRLVTDVDEARLTGALDQLVTSGLVFRRGAPPQANYLFKHALVRDAAYETLVRERRQALHGAVARTYEDRFPETAAAEPELLAHHWREAVYLEKAAGYLLTAAERALLRSATTEALSHLARGQELLSALPANEERLRLELRLEIVLGRALLASRGYTAPETQNAYRRARELCDALGDQAQLPLIIAGQWMAAWNAADHRLALHQADQMFAWSERNRRPTGMTIAHLACGMSLLPLGELANARRHLEQALQTNEFYLPGQPFLASETDGRITCLTYLHDCLLLLGLLEDAAATAKQAGEERPQQVYSRALAQLHTCRMYALERDHEKVANIAAAVLETSEKQGYPYYAATCMVYLGSGLAQCNRAERGTEICRNGIAALRRIGALVWFPRYYAYLAECYEATRDAEGGLRTLGEAFEYLERTRELGWEPELFRLQGNLLMKVGKALEAEICFERALSLARKQNARLLELRTAVSFAQLLAQTGRKSEAQETLAQLYASFAENVNHKDVSEANLVFAQVSQDLAERSRRDKITR